MMNVSDRPPTESVIYQWECAQKIVSILLNKTRLSTIIHMVPTVIVGEGNWISFAVSQAVSAEAVLRLSESPGKPTFVSDVFSRSRRARSETAPSRRLTKLDTGKALQRDVDP